VKRVEAGMWRADEIQDNIEPLIIKIGENSSSSDNSVDSDQGIVSWSDCTWWKM
jgi:hypothetical protein